MANKIVDSEARLYFVPYILGNSRASHKLSSKIYRRFGIVSFICDDRRSLLDLFDISSRSVMLTRTDSTRLICEQLVWLASQGSYTLPILISNDPRYNEIMQRENETLEAHFVISKKEDVFLTSPLASLLK